MTPIETDHLSSSVLKNSTGIFISEKTTESNKFKASPASSPLLSSYSLSSNSSISIKSEQYQEASSCNSRHSEENKSLRQEIFRYRNVIDQLKNELLQKNPVSGIDIRGLVQKTLQSTLLEKERYKREAEKERNKREELELQLTQFQAQQKQMILEKNELIKALQNQLVEAVQDVDHFQQLNDDTMSLLHHLHSQIPDFFLLLEERKGQEQEDESNDYKIPKFTIENFCFKVANLINESHQMVDKILELQTKNEQLVTQLEVSDVQDQHELAGFEGTHEQSLTPSSTDSNPQYKFGEDWFSNSEEPRILTESPFSLEDEEVQHHLGSLCNTDEKDLTYRRDNSYPREANVELVMDNLYQTQEELSKIQENLIELEENGIMLQLELEEITHQRDSLIEELRIKNEELQKARLLRNEIDARETNSFRCERCTQTNSTSDKPVSQVVNGYYNASQDLSLKLSCPPPATEEHNHKTILIRDLRMAFSQVHYKDSYLTQMIQQKFLEFLRELDYIYTHHQEPYVHSENSFAVNLNLHGTQNDIHLESAFVSPSEQQAASDISLQHATSLNASGSSLELICDQSQGYECYTEERKAVREEMEMIIKSLEMLHLE